MDRGYYDFAFWASLDSAGCRFVTRLKSHSPIRLIEARPVSGQDILTDRVVNLSERLGSQRQNPYRQPLREILVRRDDGATLRLVTNDFSRPAEVIAELYKTRWQIELFFKWIKQNLRIRKFLGRSENAVRLQVIAGLIAYLLIHYAHRLAHGSTSRLRFSQLLRANLWQRRPLGELARPKSERPPDIPQLTFDLATTPT
jgi:IS4 transposase